MTKRKVFFSFHYKNDNWRVSQVKNIGKVSNNNVLNANNWEKVKRKGEGAIKEWIDDNMIGCSCVIVLIGKKTANRKWVNYEIEQAYKKDKGLIGVYINKLKDKDGKQDDEGSNPFDTFTVGMEGRKKKLSTIIKTYKSSYLDSNNVYSYIEDNIGGWIEESLHYIK